MSHELRTPLNAILGFSQVLKMDGLEPGQEECVQQILKGGRHLLGLINEVLDISRIETGSLALSSEAVNVYELLTETLDLIRPLAAEREIRIQAPSERGCAGVVQADRQRLRQVLLNLASNAVKYNRHGGSIGFACKAAADGRTASSCTTPARASLPTSCSGCSPRSTAWVPSTPTSKAPAWAWRCPRALRRRWAAHSPRTASRAKAAPSPSSWLSPRTRSSATSGTYRHGPHRSTTTMPDPSAPCYTWRTTPPTCAWSNACSATGAGCGCSPPPKGIWSTAWHASTGPT